MIRFKKPTFIIAEAGINHNGNLATAKKMIKKAADSGADAIKFQTIIPEELFSEKENSTLFDMSKDWILSKNDHIELKKFAQKNKILFFSTPFGIKSAKLLNELKIPIIKIASGEITNHELISYIAKMGRPIILSTGMSEISEIKSAVKIIKSHKCHFAILHCISSYPTTITDCNLATIPYLEKLFKVPVGFSDHTEGLEASLAAVSLGASVIEKHFTLDKNMPGPDQKLSLDPHEFSNLSKQIRLIDNSLGVPRLKPLKSEKKFQKNMRKSVAASIDIPKNTVITNSMLNLIRPATGISPLSQNKIIGKKIKNSVKKGTILKWNNF
jgi:N-acetylneuraminate synthase/N,N'-diacetyllegionaminate synthase